MVVKGRLLLSLSALALLLAACPNPYFDRVKEVVDAAKAPRMALVAGSISVASGGSYDFGSVAVGVSKSTVFSIKNTGKTDLELSGGVSLAGTNSDQFALLALPASSVVSGGQSATFTLAFAPTSGGVKSASVSLASNDPAAGSYIFIVTGAGSATAPTFSPAPGTYSANQDVVLSSVTPGATIRYTTDGTAPTASSSLFSIAAPVPVHGNGTTVTIKAYAAAAGFADSTVVTGTFTINTSAVSTPNFSPAGGPYTADQSVTISCATPGAAIYYTTDGTTPTTASTLFSASIPVGGSGTSLTIKALAHLAGYTDSTAQASYTITYPQAPAPTTSQLPGVYNLPLTVTLNGLYPIAYTLDGSTPATDSHGTITHGTTYVPPIMVSVSTTIRAIAYSAGMTDSPVIALPYTLQALAPALTPTGGAYPSPTVVTITCTTPSASIRYTTDGSAPSSSNGTLIASGGTVLISATSSLKAIAYMAGWTDSPVTTGDFTISINQPPTILPAGGRIGNATTIDMSIVTPGSSIAYTLDGSDPTTDNLGTVTHGTAYTGGIMPPYGSFMVKAIAYQYGWGDSAVISQSYHKDLFLFSLAISGNAVDVFSLNAATGALSHTSTFGFAATPTGMILDSLGSLAFVAAISANQIWGFTIDPLTAALTANGTPAAISNPVLLHMLQNNGFLYAVDASGLIHTFQVSGGGVLTSQGTVPVGASPVAMVSDHGNNVLFTANVGDGTLSAYTMNAGLLAPAATPTIAVGGTPWDVTIHPTNTWLYASDNSGTSIRGFTWAPSTAALTSIPGSPFTVGANPAKMAIDPTGKYLYVTHSFQNTVELVRIDPGTGALTSVTTYPTGVQPTRVCVDPSGKFVCVINTGANTISVFSIDPATGFLSPAGAYPTPSPDPQDILVTGTH